MTRMNSSRIIISEVGRNGAGVGGSSNTNNQGILSVIKSVDFRFTIDVLYNGKLFNHFSTLN